MIYEPPGTLPLAHFPSLEELRLGPAALPWLHLLAARGDDQTRNGLAPPPAILNTNAKATLKLLDCPGNTPIDPILLSLISSFRNLVMLCVANDYCDKEGPCLFRLTDDDVENLAITLPSLVSLRLGGACSTNACRTSVSPLLSLLTVLALDLHFGEGGSRLLLRLLASTTSIASFGGRWALVGSPRTPTIHDNTRCGRIVNICELTKVIARSKKHCKSCLRVVAPSVAGVILVHH